MTSLRLTSLDQLNDQERSFLDSSELGQSINQHYLFNPISQRYYQEYISPDAVAKSLIVYDAEKPVLIMPMLSATETFNFAGGPSEIFCHLDDDDQHETITFLARKLKKTDAGKLLSFQNNSTLLSALFSQLHSVETTYQGFVDLTLSEDLIYRSIRKSYRPFVNWGRKELQLSIIDKSNPDEAAFNVFKKLHITASGRQTRNDATWGAQMDMIFADVAYLVNAYLDNELVSSCFVMHDKNIALYAVAASDRNRMDADQPLNHFPLYSAILEAKRKGCRVFRIGDVNDTRNTKAENIARFKRGFITDITTDQIFTVQL